MADAVRGLHETLITEALAERLKDVGRSYHVRKEPLRPADAADRLARHLAALLEKALSDVPEDSRASVGLALVRALTEQIQRHDPETRAATGNVAEPATVLHAIERRKQDGSPENIASPLIPLLDTALLTNSPGEPRVGHQILTEIESADRIDLVMAFIRRSGLGPLMVSRSRDQQGAVPLGEPVCDAGGQRDRAPLSAPRAAPVIHLSVRAHAVRREGISVSRTRHLRVA